MISVLYVDDESDLLNLGKIFLERTGNFRVDLMNSAKDALAHLKTKKYDIIISDYQMPWMDGIEFLKEVRHLYGNIPFILFTGKGREEVAILALNSGADFYLQKGGDPVAQFAELKNRIEKAVNEQQAISARQESERKLYDIINFLPDATFAINREGIVEVWNKAIEEMTGVTAGDMVGKGDYAYSIPFYGIRRPILIDLVFSDEEELIKHYSGIVRKGSVITAETTLPHPKGVPRTLWGKASPLYNESGEVIGAIESIRDISERKEIEEALKESEKKFRDMTDLLPQIVYEADLEGKLLYVNHIAFDIFGYTDEDFKEDLSVMQMIVPEERGQVLFVIKEFLKGNCPRSGGKDYHAIRKDGTIFPVTIYTAPIFTHNNITGFRGVIVDISDRMKVENELRERERILSTLISNLPGFVYRCKNDRAWTMEFISEGCRDLTGYSPEDFIGNQNLSFNDIIDPDYREHLWKKWQQTLENKEVFEEEYKIITRSGETRWVWERGRGIYSEDNTLLFLEGFITDISWRRNIEEMLKISKEQLSLAIEGSGVGLWDWEVQTGKLGINDRWGEMLGYTLDELKPVSVETWINLCHPEDLQHSNALLSKHFAGESSYYESEVRMLHKDGHWLWILDRGKVVEWDNERRPIRMAGTHLDITTWKQMENALRSSNKKLGLLTNITRHDINNQLTALRGYLELSKDYLDKPDEISSYILEEEKIAANIERLITFTKYYEGMGEGDPVWHFVKTALDNVVRSLPLDRINIDNKCQNLEIFADMLFERVLYNLVENAIRYGGQKITKISFSWHKSESGIIFVCEDDGEGVSDEDRAHLFERGFGKNTGLGLFLVREILSITRISIDETGRQGKGARFEISVPEGNYRFTTVSTRA